MTAAGGEDFRVTRVRAELRSDSDGVAIAMPRLSWTTETSAHGWVQRAAEIELDGTTRVRLAGSESVLVPWPFEPLSPRSEHTVRVRVADRQGNLSAWSEPLTVRADFLAEGEWTAPMIALPAPSEVAQPGLLRAEFTPASAVRRATLYATAQGVYQVRVNGTDVDDQIMKPGWTAYESRLIHETTDVTTLVTEGRNAIGVELAGAWWTERYGHRPSSSPRYGEQPAVALQLVLEYEDGSAETVTSGADWRCTADGPLRRSGLYDGEDYDARAELTGWSEAGFDDAAWQPVMIRSEPFPIPEARSAPAVRVLHELPVQRVLTASSGAQILDFGQNLVGRLRIAVLGPRGATVRLRHAEVLEDGELGTRPLRFAEATDTYTLRGDGEETWEPRFTFHGFRYAEVSGSIGAVDPAGVTARVIHSDMERTGWFSTSHELLNRLHENVVWSMRGNFLYLPTDCPQRDERLGWTGDIQVFVPTASFIYAVDGFLSSWLADLDAEQRRAGDGTVPFVIPVAFDDALTPAAAWGDAATVVPSVLSERYADRDVLARQYQSMRAWTDRLLTLAGDRYLWEGGFQFGDWLDPTAPPERAGEAKTAPDIVATAYLYRSVSLTAAAAVTLGFTADAARYQELAGRIRAAFRDAYVLPDGRMTSDAQTAYALALEFALADPVAETEAMGTRLAELVRENGFRIGTGFVGTPLIMGALTRTGHLDVAARLLLQTQNPSWLYPVSMGATTIWERWDSMLEDGTINPGEMTSFNHYALGAVADWLQRDLAGLAPAKPGYRAIRIAPRPLEGVDWAQARHMTPYGPASVAWHRQDDGTLHVEAAVPANSSAEVLLPGWTETVSVGSGTYSWIVDPGPRPVSARTRR